MSLPATTGLGGHHLIIGIWFYFIFRVYLIFVQAILLIFKHAMFLRPSNTTESALNFAGLHYQKADIDLRIQDYLKASSLEHSVEEITSFIMATEIGMFIVCIVILISHQEKISSIPVFGRTRRRSLVDKILGIPWFILIEKHHTEEWVQCCRVWEICLVELACMYDAQSCYPKLVPVPWLTMRKALSQVVGVPFLYYLSLIESPLPLWVSSSLCIRCPEEHCEMAK